MWEHQGTITVLNSATKDAVLIVVLLLLSLDRLWVSARVTLPILIIAVMAPYSLVVGLYNSTFATDYPKEMALISLFNVSANLIITIFCFGLLYRETGI